VYIQESHRFPTHFHLTTEGLTLAKSMLSSSRVPLVDVAARMGFQTQQHLPKYFIATRE
jgi:AraC family transcriptional regulator